MDVVTSDVGCSLFFFSFKLLGSAVGSSVIVPDNAPMVVVPLSVVLLTGGGSIIVKLGINLFGASSTALPSEQAKLEQPLGATSTL